MMNLSGGELVAIGLLGLLLLAKFCVAVIAVIHLILSPRPTEQKLLWGIVILLVPLIGGLIYFAFGRKSAAV